MAYHRGSARQLSASGGYTQLRIENLFDRDYTTVWGSGTTVLQPGYGPASLYDYKGRG